MIVKELEVDDAIEIGSIFVDKLNDMSDRIHDGHGIKFGGVVEWRPMVG